MALTADDVREIETLLGAGEASAQALADLRRRFPGLSVTRCDPSDLGVETPFREFARVALHLVDGSDHCWRLTDDPARATGLVVVPLKVRA
ncbi:MAG TPA: hypothetical protein VG986_11445 [Pseudolabrys sp.]|nr:hypothetical protein [Pseudolabrys sp.]